MQANTEQLDLQWLRDFERVEGRPLRVLHIGNIANNAYNNARIQRNHGVEADVVCYDYYHIMGTPEWEDAEIKGDVGNAFYPDWWAVDLGDWQRPDWFVQGPLRNCLDYLSAKHAGDLDQAAIARASLVCAIWQMVRHHNGVLQRGKMSGPFGARYRRRTLAIAPETKNIPNDTLEHIRALVSTDLAALVGPRVTALANIHAMRASIANATAKLEYATEVLMKREADGAPSAAVASAIKALGKSAARGTAFLPVYALRGAVRKMREVRSLARTVENKARVNNGSNVSSVPNATVERSAAERRQRIWAEYRTLHQELSAAELAEDVAEVHRVGAPFAGVLDYYDVVQGYSTDGVIPLFAGFERFAAYEHGTIREIPFQNTTQGRLCNFTYKKAPVVFVTNTDVLPSIPRIGIDPANVVNLPHAFNDAKLRNFRDKNPELKPPAGPAVFFSPTRHHWKSGDGSWLKGNDRLLKAAGMLAREGKEFRLVLVEWGVEIAESRALIEAEGISDRVTWIPAMNKRDLWRRYCESHAVVDQFTLPAIGGVAFETLALGRRLITRIDTDTLAKFFGEAPPTLTAATAEEVAEKMREVIADPDDLRGVGTEARSWIKNFHSAERVLDLQLRAYRRLIDSTSAETKRTESAA